MSLHYTLFYSFGRNWRVDLLLKARERPLRWQPIGDERQTVNPLSLHDRFPVQMRSTATPAIPAGADYLPGVDPCSLGHVCLRQVRIKCVNAKSMIDHNGVAADLELACKCNPAGCHRVYRGTVRRPLIPTGVAGFNAIVQNSISAERERSYRFPAAGRSRRRPTAAGNPDAR